MAQRGDYSTDTKFASYEKAGGNGVAGTDSEKSSYGGASDGPHSYLPGSGLDYLHRDFTDAELAVGGTTDNMKHWSDPPYPMTIGRIEADRSAKPNANDGGDLQDPAKTFKQIKHFKIRQGVETADMISGDGEGEGGYGGF